MSQTIDVNGQSINYPETGDTNWGDEATDFAVQTSAALGKLGLASGTSVDIGQTLDVTGNTTLDANLSVGGNASVTGNTTLTGNITVNGNSTLGNGTSDTIAITGILNVDSGVLYVDPTNNRVGINDATPSEALDVTGNVAITGNETVGGTLNVTGAATLSSTLAVTGNSTLTGNLSVNGNSTLGDASGDSLTINSNGVSIPNGLNFDSNTLVIDAANNRVGIGVASPSVPLDIQSNASAIGMDIRGRSADNIGLIRFLNNAGTARQRIGLISSDALSISNAATTETFTIAQNGQLNAVVPGGSTLYPGYLCRAWVNFNGAGTVAIRASGNVTSITDNGTGDYTINFTTAMPDANYTFTTSCQRTASGAYSAQNIITSVGDGANLVTASSLRARCYGSTGNTGFDADIYTVAIFR